MAKRNSWNEFDLRSLNSALRRYPIRSLVIDNYWSGEKHPVFHVFYGRPLFKFNIYEIPIISRIG